MKKRNWKNLLGIPLVLLLTHCGIGSNPDYTGQSTPTASLLVSGGSVYDFGYHPVSQSTQKTFTVTNVGLAKAMQMSGSFYLSQSFAFEGGAYPGTTGNCGASLGVNENCTISVVFTPSSSGSAQSVIMISYQNGDTVRVTNEPALLGRGI